MSKVDELFKTKYVGHNPDNGELLLSYSSKQIDAIKQALEERDNIIDKAAELLTVSGKNTKAEAYALLKGVK